MVETRLQLARLHQSTSSSFRSSTAESQLFSVLRTSSTLCTRLRRGGMAPIALQDFSYNRVPDPDASDVEAGPATSSGRDEQRDERARRWHLALAFGLGVLFSAACYGVWHLSGSRAPGAAAGGKAAGDALDVQTSATSSTSTSSTAAPTTSSSTDKPFTLHFHGEPSINKHGPISSPGCPIAVEYTEDAAAAQGVVYNSDSYEGLSQEERDRRRIGRPWQKQVIWGSESAPNRAGLERYFQSIKEDGTSDLYDADMTCERRSLRKSDLGVS